MSKNKNGGAEALERQQFGTAGVEGVNGIALFFVSVDDVCRHGHD